MSEECIRILEERVIQSPIAGRFKELMQSGQSPVCLFSTRKACEEFNNKMLSRLQCKMVEICYTEIWTKLRACINGVKRSKRANKDCP